MTDNPNFPPIGKWSITHYTSGDELNYQVVLDVRFGILKGRKTFYGYADTPDQIQRGIDQAVSRYEAWLAVKDWKSDLADKWGVPVHEHP